MAPLPLLQKNIDKDNGNMVYKYKVDAANSFMKPRFF